MTVGQITITEPTVQAYNLPEGFFSADFLKSPIEFRSEASGSGDAVDFARITLKALVITSAGVASTVLPGEVYAWSPIVSAGHSDVMAVTPGGELESAAELASLTRQYKKISDALNDLGRLDEDEPHHLDSETVASSLQFTSLLYDFHVPPPRILPHGGDAVIFQWQRDSGVRYATYEDGVARLRDQGARAEYASAVKFDLRRPEDIATFIQAIGGKQWRVKRSSSSI